MKKLNILLFILIVPTITLAQSFFKNMDITVGFALQTPDRRLFEWPMGSQKGILARDRTHFDNEYSLLLSKQFKLLKILSLSAGLGYSLSKTNFRRPFNHNSFTNLGTYELRFIDRYLIHHLNLTISPQYEIIRKNDNIFYLNAPMFAKFNFNKDVKDISFNGWHHDKWQFEFNKFEVYLGLGYQYKRVGFNMAYRIYNIQKIDPVIFSLLGATRAYYTDFYDKGIEEKNYKKMMFSVSYRIGH